MTARVTTLKCATAGAYYVEALPSYYLDAGEPKGVWLGDGATLLGLTGDVADDDFLRLMAGLDPRTSGDVPLGRPYDDRSVRGFDVTASAPKSVSTLFAVGDVHTRTSVLAAHDTAVRIVLQWIEAHAHTRYRVNGQVVTVDADGLIAAAFRQHTSRALDPQLHTHLVIGNRVRSPDGRWLALDARTLKLDQRTVSAVYHATLRSELTGRLGVEWGPVLNGIAEIAGVPDRVLEEFSARTADVQRRIDEKLDRFTDTFERDPTPRERWRLEREAVIDSRPAKAHGVDATALHDQWAERVEAIGVRPARMIRDLTDRAVGRSVDRLAIDDVIAQAIQSISERQSSWRPAELTREIAVALPSDLELDATRLLALLEQLADRALAERCVDISRPIPDNAVLRRDGRPVTEASIGRALTTPAILAQEERLLAWADRRTAHDIVDSAGAADRSTVALTGPQAETAARVAGDGDLVLVVGPAGTGKTTALAPAVAQLQADGRAVFGVAPSAAAAEVLAAETGIGADTIDKLLTEHSLRRPPDHRYDLPVGATVIVDEAAMVPTERLDQLAALADERGWRIALVGDPMQFSAVGRGGMFELLTDTYGAIELDQVHRFSNEWERTASLQLRRGDPAAAELYDLHGRIHGGTATRMEAAALDAWQSARANGESVLMAAPTNDAVTRLNRAAQQRRLDSGELEPRSRTVTAGGYRLHVGDEIATRQNDRHLHTDRGRMIRNRDQWVIDTVHRNGDLTVTGSSGTARLPAGYVRQHVELGYAQTSHATQGRTVDRSLLVLDGPTDVRGLYVPMTRGRHQNDAYIAVRGEEIALDIFTESLRCSWIDRPALARQAELAGAGHRPGTIPAVALRALLDERTELTKTFSVIESQLATLPREITSTRQRRDDVAARLAADAERLQVAFDTLKQHDRPLFRRGHESDIANSKQTIQRLPDVMSDTAKLLDGHKTKLHGLEHRLATAERQAVGQPDRKTRLRDVSERLDHDLDIRTRQARHDPPSHAVRTLGERPRSVALGREWDRAAAELDQHHTAYGNLPASRTLPNVASYQAALEAAQRVPQPRRVERSRAIERDGPDFGISM